MKKSILVLLLVIGVFLSINFLIKNTINSNYKNQFQKNISNDSIVVEVIGNKAKWIIRYPGKDRVLGKRQNCSDSITEKNIFKIDKSDPASKDDYFTDEIHLVKGIRVVFILGAIDKIHGFYLPHQRMKMDCIPNIETKISFMPNETTEEIRKKLSHDTYWSLIDPNTNEPKWKGFENRLECDECCLLGRNDTSLCVKYKVIIEEKEKFDKWEKMQKTIFKK